MQAGLEGMGGRVRVTDVGPGGGSESTPMQRGRGTWRPKTGVGINSGGISRNKKKTKKAGGKLDVPPLGGGGLVPKPAPEPTNGLYLRVI